ncbi:hypothetical protein [Streptomyces sp. 1222.5]|uniref:hypothetical protein n=1 Tax=Streptomyces sp. 1222.5 TaxID=1881026 RepID=UPI003EBBCEEF
MKNSGTSRAREGAMGQGYAKHSRVQHEANDYGIPLLTRALEVVPLPLAGEAFRAADLGAAAGTNSLKPMRAVVEGIRRRTGNLTPVVINHTDILANDFNALLATVSGHSATYTSVPQVFTYVEARSFYEPLFPPAEVHLAWSAIAVHWLSRLDLPIADHIYCSRATGQALEAMKERSRKDWERFLNHRATELRAGGQLIVLGGACADETSSGAEALLDTANAVLADQVKQKMITGDEYARMTIPTWNRTEAEFLAPLQTGDLAKSFKLEEHALVELPDVLLEKYRTSGDAQAFAAEVTAFFQAAFQPSLFSSLRPSRSQSELKVLSDAFAAGMRARILTDPTAVETNWHVVTLRLTRR